MLELHEYDQKYLEYFQTEQNKIRAIIGSDYIIEHIGSTAVPGLDGKGVIDIMLAFDNIGDVKIAYKSLLNSGYYYGSGDSDQNGRIFMSTSGTNESVEGDVHLHMITKDNAEYSKFILFRNYLINHPDVRQTYNSLKYEILEKVEGNRIEYTKLKSPFIKSVINLAQNEKRYKKMV